jgi:hypothetical protein
MNAISLVVDQHREIEGLARALLVAAPDSRAHVLRLLADRLESHMEVEEKILYPTVRTHRDANAIQAYLHDHHDLRTLVVRLMGAGFTHDPMFIDQAALLATMLREHAHDEEEAHLLPLLAISMSESELDALGAEMLALHQELMAREPFRTMVPNSRDHAYSRVG